MYVLSMLNNTSSLTNIISNKYNKYFNINFIKIEQLLLVIKYASVPKILNTSSFILLNCVSDTFHVFFRTKSIEISSKIAF